MTASLADRWAPRQTDGLRSQRCTRACIDRSPRTGVLDSRAKLTARGVPRIGETVGQAVDDGLPRAGVGVTGVTGAVAGAVTGGAGQPSTPRRCRPTCRPLSRAWYAPHPVRTIRYAAQYARKLPLVRRKDRWTPHLRFLTPAPAGHRGVRAYPACRKPSPNRSQTLSIPLTRGACSKLSRLKLSPPGAHVYALRTDRIISGLCPACARVAKCEKRTMSKPLCPACAHASATREPRVSADAKAICWRWSAMPREYSRGFARVRRRVGLLCCGISWRKIAPPQ